LKRTVCRRSRRVGAHDMTQLKSAWRFAGGQRADAGSILELVDASSPARHLYGNAGLQFLPFGER
jgi:hypothetical protein